MKQNLSACIGVFDSSTPVETVVEILKSNDYSAIELLGEPTRYDSGKINSLMKQSGLRVSALTACSRLKTGRDLASKDRATREKTIDHYRKCIEEAAKLSCPIVGITLTSVGRFAIEDDYQSELGRALESVQYLSTEAKKSQKWLAIEILNRYVSFLVNTVSECQQFIASGKFDNVGICADLFHMNIEEANIASSVENAGHLLKNIHISDSNRLGIGHGHLDFTSVYDALKKNNYDGPLTLEAWSLTKTPFGNKNSSADEIKGYLEEFSIIINNLNNRE